MLTTKPITSAILQQAIDGIATRFPFVRTASIGNSHMGRPIHVLTVGSGNKTILFNASHHANEWITSIVAMQFLEDFARAYEKNPTHDITLHIVPMVNPDGVDIVTGGIAHNHPVYQKATEMAAAAPDIHPPFPGCWKANAIGVDLNSNYPAGWHLAKEHKFARGYTQPGPRDYVGQQPLCQPESAAMAAYTRAHNFDRTISLHTQGEVIFWRYQDYMPPGAEDLARRLTAASGYECEDVPDTSSHAGYRDWFIAEFNRPGMTIECGLGENPLPLSDFEGIYKKTAPLLWEALR